MIEYLTQEVKQLSFWWFKMPLHTCDDIISMKSIVSVKNPYFPHISSIIYCFNQCQYDLKVKPTQMTVWYHFNSL